MDLVSISLIIVQDSITSTTASSETPKKPLLSVTELSNNTGYSVVLKSESIDNTKTNHEFNFFDSVESIKSLSDIAITPNKSVSTVVYDPRRISSSKEYDIFPDTLNNIYYLNPNNQLSMHYFTTGCCHRNQQHYHSIFKHMMTNTLGINDKLFRVILIVYDHAYLESLGVLLLGSRLVEGMIPKVLGETLHSGGGGSKLRSGIGGAGAAGGRGGKGNVIGKGGKENENGDNGNDILKSQFGKNRTMMTVYDMQDLISKYLLDCELPGKRSVTQSVVHLNINYHGKTSDNKEGGGASSDNRGYIQDDEMGSYPDSGIADPRAKEIAKDLARRRSMLMNGNIPGSVMGGFGVGVGDTNHSSSAVDSYKLAYETEKNNTDKKLESMRSMYGLKSATLMELLDRMHDKINELDKDNSKYKTENIRLKGLLEKIKRGDIGWMKMKSGIKQFEFS
jgi:hypothetical protein